MANAARKWLPLALIAGAMATGAWLVRDLPPTVTIDLRGLLPFALEPTGDSAPRWVAVLGLPAIATSIWALLNAGRRPAAMRLTRLFFRDTPEALTDPAVVDRFRGTYDTIVLCVVVLILGVHAGMIAAALGHDTLGPRIITVVMGISLAAAGNVMPRLRPNLVAGVRTRATLTDPALWRATHRVLGFGFVIAGIVTAIVGLAAPAYGLPTAVVTLIAACILATVGGLRARRATASPTNVWS